MPEQSGRIGAESFGEKTKLRIYRPRAPRQLKTPLTSLCLKQGGGDEARGTKVSTRLDCHYPKPSSPSAQEKGTYRSFFSAVNPGAESAAGLSACPPSLDMFSCGKLRSNVVAGASPRRIGLEQDQGGG